LINAAARVESLTKYYGVLFLITREAYCKLSEPPMVRIIDKAVVKGKSVPLEILEVRHPHSREDFGEVVTRYNAAFAAYETGAFGEAERLFAELRDGTNDKPSALMAERCRELAMDPPMDWGGVYHLTSK
jgi:adenylate cyclase